MITDDIFKRLLKRRFLRDFKNEIFQFDGVYTFLNVFADSFVVYTQFFFIVIPRVIPCQGSDDGILANFQKS